MTQEDQVQVKHIQAFDGGLNTNAHNTEILDSEISAGYNTTLDQGKLSVDTGFVSQPKPNPLVGSIRHIYRMARGSNTVLYFLFTTTRIYYRSGSNPASAWTLVEDGVGAAVTFIYSATEVPIVVVPWEAEDTIIWTNGVDPVQKIYHDGSDWICEPIGGLAGAGDDPTVDFCGSIAVWNDRLLLFNTTESTVNKGALVRWSDEANFEEWRIAADSPGSDAGFQYLYDDGGVIRHALPLDTSLVIYRASAITLATWIGSDAKTIDFNTVINSIALLGYRGIAVTPEGHYVSTTTGILRYNGGTTATPVSDKIDNIFHPLEGLNDEILLTDLVLGFGLYVPVDDSCWFVYPNHNSTDATIFVYDMKRKIWHKRYYQVPFVGVSSMYEPGDAFIYHIYLLRSAALLDYNFEEDEDAGVAIAWYFHTRNFPSERFIKTDKVELEVSAVGDGGVTFITVAYSIDGGSSWKTFGQLIAPQPAIDNIYEPEPLILYTMYKQIRAKNIMFRISGTEGKIRMGRFSFYYFDESEY